MTNGKGKNPYGEDDLFFAFFIAGKILFAKRSRKHFRDEKERRGK